MFKVGDRVLVQVLVQEDIWVGATIVEVWPNSDVCKYKIVYKDEGARYSKDSNQIRSLGFLFYPWTSPNGPHPPENWGLDVFRGKCEPFVCETCNKSIRILEPYLYSYRPTGTIIRHNTAECFKEAV